MLSLGACCGLKKTAYIQTFRLIDIWLRTYVHRHNAPVSAPITQRSIPPSRHTNVSDYELSPTNGEKQAEAEKEEKRGTASTTL